MFFLTFLIFLIPFYQMVKANLDEFQFNAKNLSHINFEIVKPSRYPKFDEYVFPLDHSKNNFQFKRSLLKESTKKPPKKLGIKKLSGKIPKNVCPFEKVFCSATLFYRTYDGSCNNLENSWYGMSESPYRRMLPPEYDDNIDSPRTKSVVDNQPLPNPRLLAMFVHVPNITIGNISNLFVFFAQALSHDISSIASAVDFNGFPIGCACDSKEPICFNIPIPVEDFTNRDLKCFNFPRSSSSINNFDCDFAHREQSNTVTHFVDLSFLYGSHPEIAKETRARVRGWLLAVRIRGGRLEFLPFRSSPFCRGLTHADSCFRTGDARSESNAFLIALQTIFLRQHNLIARALLQVNPSWNDDKLFEETRKIMIALHQHITYNQLLPLLLGNEYYNKFELKPLRDSFFMGYDKNIEPYVYNELATAALRFGHTLIKNENHKAHANYSLFEKAVTNDFLFASLKYFQNGVETQEDYLRGMVSEHAYIPSNAVNPSLNHKLFEGFVQGETKRFSLPALNIQRGRDHGLPGYNKYRELCGLKRAQSFDEFDNIRPDFKGRLGFFYKHPDDVDLWTGASSEDPVKGGEVGETFACMLAMQFRDLKIGDRFYYENGQDPKIGFTLDQLNEIRKFTMERMLCNTANIEFIQNNSFMVHNVVTNPFKKCNEFPDLNFEKWRIV